MTAFVVLFVVAVVPLAPTEAVLIGYGVLAASGELSLTAVIAVAALGCTLSDFVNFGVGRGVGLRALERVGRRPGPRAVIAWTAERLATRGESILVAVRFVPGGGLVGAVLAGSLRWRLRRFAPIAAVGATLWSAYTATLGYFGGQLFTDPVVATLVSFAVATLVGVPIGMAVRAAQRRAVAA
ncbi:VTT domain-containing protein [Actinosynnema sp. NPDC002837]